MSEGSPIAIERFSTGDAIDKYREIASEGLTAQESTIVEKYFAPSLHGILDIGCGAGRTTHALAERGFDVTGVDLSERMIRAARELYPDLDFQVDDATNLSFDDETFGHVLFSYSGLDGVHPAEQRTVALKEIFRVLKPGGTFAFSSNNLLYSLPALALDRQHLDKFYFQNGNLRRLFSPFKRVPQYSSEVTYFSDPFRQRKQLEAVGFDFLEHVGKRDGPAKFFERQPYYVAQKPPVTGDQGNS